MADTSGEHIVIANDFELILSILDSVNKSFSDYTQLNSIVRNLRLYFQCDTVAIRLFDYKSHDQFSENGFYDEIIDHEGPSNRTCIQCEFRNSLMSFCDKIFRTHPIEGNDVITEFGSFYTGDYLQFYQQNKFEYALASKRCAEEKFSSILLIPLKWEGETIGILQCDSSQKEYFTKSTIEVLERISVNLAGAILNNQQIRYLKRVSALFTKAQSEAKIGSWAIDTEKGVFIYGDNINELHQYDFEINKTTVFEFLHDRLDEEVVDEFTNRIQNFKENETLFFDYRGKLADGSFHYYRTIGSYFDNAIQGFTLDITEHVQDKLLIEENKAFLESIVTGLNTAIIVIDPQKDLVVEANDFAQNLYGMTRDEIEGIHGTTLLSPQYFKDAKILGTKSPNMHSYEEGLLRHSDNSFIPVQRIIMETTMDHSLYYVVILYDISEHKQLEQQLAHSQKMESIGSLAAGIAHEINTPIQYIGDNTHFLKEGFSVLLDIMENYHELAEKVSNKENYSSLLSEIRSLEDEGDAEFLLEEIPVALCQSIDGIERVSSIVQAMKKFSHPGNSEMSMKNLNDIIEDTVIVARNEWKYNSELTTDLSPELPKIPIHSADISQVILNLIVNASHAISDVVSDGEKGAIHIKTEYDDEFVEVVVSDSGSGIDPKIYDKIFNPFFTTKDVGIGTGQGLSMAYSIITEKHRGVLSFDSELGVGTSFNIKLPRRNNG